MTFAEIDEVIESIREDAENDIEDFKRIYEALITLRMQREALLFARRVGIAPDMFTDREPQ